MSSEVSSKIYQMLYKISILSDLHGTRFILAISELIWGITLWMPGQTFGRPTYNVMAHFIPDENIWGAIWIISGLIQIYIIYKSDYHSRLAVLFAGFNSLLWWFVTISMYLSVSPPPAAISGETGLALAAMWVWIRSGWVPKSERRTLL